MNCKSENRFYRYIRKNTIYITCIKTEIQTCLPFWKIYVMIYDRAKFEYRKWRATFNATTYAEAVPASVLKARPAGTWKCMALCTLFLCGVSLTVACHFWHCRFSGSYMWTQMFWKAEIKLQLVPSRDSWQLTSCHHCPHHVNSGNLW